MFNRERERVFGAARPFSTLSNSIRNTSYTALVSYDAYTHSSSNLRMKWIVEKNKISKEPRQGGKNGEEGGGKEDGKGKKKMKEKER